MGLAKVRPNNENEVVFVNKKFIDIIDYGYGCTTPVVHLLRYIV